MLLSDLKSEEDIPMFAALEFKKYGQPLGNFLQLFTLKSKPARRVAIAFVRALAKIPTSDYDVALTEFAEEQIGPSYRHRFHGVRASKR